MVGGESKTWHDVPAARAAGAHTILPPFTSFRIVDGAGLSDDGDLDRGRILELVLDAARDVFREHIASSSEIFSLSTMIRIRGRPAGRTTRTPLNESAHPFELLETFHVRFEDVSPRAWTRRRNRIRAPGPIMASSEASDFHVMRGHRHDYGLVSAVLAQVVDPN